MNNSLQLDLTANGVRIKANDKHARNISAVVIICLITITFAAIVKVLR